MTDGKGTNGFTDEIVMYILLLSLIGVRKLSEVLGYPKWETDLISIFFVISPGILMQAAFFRMYVMAMCDVTWVICSRSLYFIIR